MYDHKEIDKKWKEAWQKQDIYKTSEDQSKKKEYVLPMFPYPSGEGLHVGHARVFTSTDIYARKKKMEGFRVLHPMGWDAFGLPAEQFALKHKIHPSESIKKNTDRFRDQLQTLGMSYDWDREINTTDPAYYKWTQWIFLQLFKRGLVYESYEPVNWCPTCKTVLANEDLVNGLCERCGTPVQRKPMRQWKLRITDYADRLVDDLDTLHKWPKFVLDLQRNWIGRGSGYAIPFTIPLGDSLEKVEVFTTRPDTLFGCAFLAVSPESSFVDTLLTHVENKEEVEAYRQEMFSQNLQTRRDPEGEKTGVACKGIHAIHPITKEEVPIFIADYVLGGYGTGVIFAAPGHDQRDYDFAKKFDLPIKRVVEGDNELPDTETAPDARLVDSGAYTGLTSEEAKEKITKDVGGEKKTVYKLQDWVFSRQRYWGEPIPLIHCEKCGVVPVPEEELPLKLPDVKSYEPTGTGESPLAAIDDWVNTTCPICGGPAKRETNTMPQWAGSCWYYLRFIDPHNDKKFVDPAKEKDWMDVDTYVGGLEHATRHIIYARFWHKVLYDEGLVSSPEPFETLHGVGIVQKEGGGKMSKREGTVVDPLDVSAHVGADAFRVYIAHIAPFTQTVAWNSQGIAGPRRFLERVYMLKDTVKDVEPSKEVLQAQHIAVLAVSRDIDAFKFNTAVSQLMIFSNALQEQKEVPRSAYETLLILLAPFAPFLVEELWHEIGHTDSIHIQDWPVGDPEIAKKATAEVVVQINGKKRGVVTVATESEKEEVLQAIQEDEKLAQLTKGAECRAFVKDKLISFTV